MEDKNVKAIIIATGTTVEVYKISLRGGKWINASDCTTEYNATELKFIK